MVETIGSGEFSEACAPEGRTMTLAKILATPVSVLTFAAFLRRVGVRLALMTGTNPFALTNRTAVRMAVTAVVVLLVPGG